MLAEVMEFYGMSWNDVLDIETIWFYKLYRRIEIVQARRQYAWLNVLSYPHIADKASRDKIIKQLEVKAEFKKLTHLAATSPVVQEQGWARLRAFASPPT